MILVKKTELKATFILFLKVFRYQKKKKLNKEYLSSVRTILTKEPNMIKNKTWESLLSFSSSNMRTEISKQTPQFHSLSKSGFDWKLIRKRYLKREYIKDNFMCFTLAGCKEFRLFSLHTLIVKKSKLVKQISALIGCSVTSQLWFYSSARLSFSLFCK